MEDRIKNFISNLELKATRHGSAVNHFTQDNDIERMNMHKGQAIALRNTMEWLKIDFLN